MQIRCGVAQIVWQSFGKGGFVRTRNWQFAYDIIPTEPTAEALADTPKDASREGLPAGRIDGSSQYLEQPLEVLGDTVHGKCRDIFESEVWRDFADTPGARFVCCVRKLMRILDPWRRRCLGHSAA